ncbi:MAG TPA: MBL fold metallo-hydrolase, partial [Gammaproteobacteria bacterium]|nr:MBL fold metallo-hydrolase [Gammaproteobacteria bacterium]
QFHAFLEKHGMDRASAQQVVEQYVQSQLTSPLPEKILPIKAGDIFAAGPYRFQAYILGGHSDAQVILFDAETGAALVSDHLLQFITPNIALWPYGDRKPLTSYFKSLEVLKGLNIQTVLPGHHKVYRTADQRIEQLKVHHR